MLSLLCHYYHPTHLSLCLLLWILIHLLESNLETCCIPIPTWHWLVSGLATHLLSRNFFSLNSWVRSVGFCILYSLTLRHRHLFSCYVFTKYLFCVRHSTGYSTYNLWIFKANQNFILHWKSLQTWTWTWTWTDLDTPIDSHNTESTIQRLVPCHELEGWDGRREFKREEIYVYI